MDRRDPAEVERRRQHANVVTGSLALEGLKASPEVDALTERWVAGELDNRDLDAAIEDLIERTRDRQGRGPESDG